MAALAHCEAVIDFGDDDREDGVNETDIMGALRPKIMQLRNRLLAHLQDGKQGEL